MNLDFTFLTEEQIFGDNKLKIFDYYGTKAAITDFAILLGGHVNDFFHYNNSSSLENRTGWYWTSSDNKDDGVHIVTCYGDSYYNYISRRYGGARPSINYSQISSIAENKIVNSNGILTVEYGKYPQKAVSKELQDELENAYNYNQSSIEKTEKTYTTDSRKYNEYDEEFIAQSIDEFEYKGKKYVRVKVNSCFGGREFTLSNGESYKDGDYVWVEVSPIKWLVDEENDIAVSEKLLFAGVQFNHERNYKGDFANTTIKKFMDECFSKEIIVNSNEISNNTIYKKEEVTLNTTNMQPEINKENMSIDNMINEVLFKMNEILGEENQKVFTKVKK